MAIGERLYCSICFESTSVFQKVVQGQQLLDVFRPPRKPLYTSLSHMLINTACIRLISSQPCSHEQQVPVLLTNSAMHQFQEHRDKNSYGDSFHLERISILGAKFCDLGHVLSFAYFNQEVVLEVFTLPHLLHGILRHHPLP